MPTATEILDRQYLQMRERLLSLAADIDRLMRAPDSAKAKNDPRFQQLRQAVTLLTSDAPNRAEQLQLILSDKS